MVCFISSMIYSKYEPFDDEADDHLQAYCQLQLFLSLLIGLLFKVNRSVVASAPVAEDETTDGESDVFGVLLILNSLSVLVGVVFSSCWPVVHEFVCRRKKASSGAKVAPNSLLGALRQETSFV